MPPHGERIARLHGFVRPDLFALRVAGAAMMRRVAYNEELAERVRAVLADRTDVEEKKMFGGLSFMVAGQMCCGVLKNDLIVRIEPAELDQLVEPPLVRPFDFTGRPMQNMVYVDNSALGDPEDLRAWVRRGTEYVAAHPAAAKRRRRG